MRIARPPTFWKRNWRSFSIALQPEDSSELPGRLVLIGHPVAHSLSPTFQNAALRAARIDLTYEAIDVPTRDLRVTLRELGSDGAAGNVTIPHKTAVHASCDVLTGIAARVGAVNTFWFREGKLHGDNTDVAGFDAAAKALLGGETHDARVVVFGSGGAAAAVLAAIEQWQNAHVAVVARHPDRAGKLARRFRDVARAEKSLDRALAGANLVVNATPVGQQDDSTPIPVENIPRDAAVMDLVYRRGGTPWVKAAREQGNRAADGLPMLIEQGALSFERWFGFAPDREAMRKSLV
jgi:shikimate dehydrogenase